MSDDFVLRIPSLSGLSQGAQFRGNTIEGKVGKEIVIEFATMPGPMVELELIRPTQSTIGVRTRYRFLEGSKTYLDLTVSRIEELRKNADFASAQAQRKIPKWQADLESLKRAFDTTNNHSPANNIEAGQKKIELARLDGVIRQAQSSIQRESEILAEAKARLFDNSSRNSKWPVASQQ